MAHILGVYYAPEHRRPADAAYIEQLQPPVIRLLDPDVQHIADMHRMVSGAIIAPRTWAIDDGSSEEEPSKQVRRLMADPIGTGRDHAEQYRGQLDRWQREAQERRLTLPPVDKILFNAANEPNQGGTPERIAEYNVAFLGRCTELGIRAAALCLGVGWPGNDGTPDAPVDWEPYRKAGLVEAIKRGNHVLELHEYFYFSGPQDGWRWLAGRHLQCPFDVPILLGEIGIDNYVDTARWEQDGGNRGWVDHVGAEQYADMIAYHIRHSDKRVFAALPFLTDFRDGHEWWSFDTYAAHGALLARRHTMTPDAPHTVNIPSITIHNPPQESVTVTAPAPLPDTLDPLALEALINVESAGRNYGSDGRLAIRFEAHIFRDKLRNDEVWAQHFRHSLPSWTGQEWRRWPNDSWLPIHTGQQASEYAAFEFARSINAEAAHQSISMGAPQIMGFNHKRIGYASATAMFNAFQRSLNAQVVGLLNFIWSNDDLARAINARDWRTVARLYNGSGNVDHYANLMAQAYAKLI